MSKEIYGAKTPVLQDYSLLYMMHVYTRVQRLHMLTLQSTTKSQSPVNFNKANIFLLR